MFSYKDSTTNSVINTQVILCTDFNSEARHVKAALEREPKSEFDWFVHKINKLFLEGPKVCTLLSEMEWCEIMEIADHYSRTIHGEVAVSDVTPSVWHEWRQRLIDRGCSKPYDLVHTLCIMKGFEENLVPIAVFVANYCAMRNDVSPLVLNSAFALSLQEYAEMRSTIRLYALLDNYARYRSYLSDELAHAYTLFNVVVHFGRRAVDTQGNNVYTLKFDDYILTASLASTTTVWVLTLATSKDLIGSVKYNPATMQLYGKQGISFDKLDDVYQHLPYITCTTTPSEITNFDRIVEHIKKFGLPAASVLRTDTAVWECSIGKYMYKYIEQSDIKTIEAICDTTVVAIYDRNQKGDTYFNDVLAEDYTSVFDTLLQYRVGGEDTPKLEDMFMKYLSQREVYATDVKSLVIVLSQLIRATNKGIADELAVEINKTF